VIANVTSCPRRAGASPNITGVSPLGLALS
jgi:hypothetical protein